MTMTQPSSPEPLGRIRDEIRRRESFLVTSHAKPDGDAVGSVLAMAAALRAQGKRVRAVSRDPIPDVYSPFPGVNDVEVVDRVTGPADALIVMECGTLSRTGLDGLDGYFAINIDHHLGNTHYGALNWVDESAAACGEMVFDLVRALGTPVTREIATHLYVAILTDTGAFHHSNITARTFEVCKAAVDAGADPRAVAHHVYASGPTGKLKLMGALLDRMELDDDERLAVLHLNDDLLRSVGCTYDDTEGLINLPLSAGAVQSVVMFKTVGHELRVSLRSKGTIDVRAVAQEHGGGGHRNASGFTAAGTLEAIKPDLLARVRRAIDEAPEA